jgi:hypothetical protein
MRILILAAATVVLSGCGAVAEKRISTALYDAGLSKTMSSCIADRMVDKLSMEQLRSISRLKDKSASRPKDVGIAEFLVQHRGDLDPEVYSVITRASVGCAIGA